MSTSSVGAYDAKTHLPRLLNQVEQGDSVTITKHGRPVARLVPVGTSADADEVISALLSARTGIRLRGSVRKLIDEGRR